MHDLYATLALIALFGIAFSYVVGCERLKVVPRHD